MKNIITSIILLGSLAWMSCEKSTVTEDTTGLQGTWNLNSISGGIAGHGYQAKFDALKVNASTFELLKSKAVMYTGTYTLVPSAAQADSFKITSAPSVAEFFTNISSKKIDFVKGNLVLTEPCCDLYTYEFSRAVN
jgi:hypothetical protein